MDLSLMILDVRTDLIYMCIFFMVYLCSMSEAYTLKRLQCFKDLCERGLQYCVKEEERCYHCKDVVRNCGSDEMPLECDAFCRGNVAIERERKLNKTFDEYIAGMEHANNTVENLNSEEYVKATYIVFGALALIIAGLIAYIVKSELAKRSLSQTGKDVEKEPLVPRVDNNEQGTDEMIVQDKTKDVQVDEDEADVPSDVSLLDKTKRDSQASGDSAIESLHSSDDAKVEEGEENNEESVPKTDIGQGSRMHRGPTKERNVLPVTRAMNPTKGENSSTFELALDIQMSPLHKQNVKPVTLSVS